LHEGLIMKKILGTGAMIAGALLVAGSALAADLKAPAPMLMKAPPPPVMTWTGCYVGGGAGYGLWNQESFAENAGGATTAMATSGGRGWFGTASVGCDYQFNSNIVIGAFGDWDFGSIKGQFEPGGLDVVGTESEKWAWGAGGRIGWLVSPTFLTYFAGGYTQAHFDPINFSSATAPFAPSAVFLDSHTYNGWFLGSGFDYAISMLPAGFFLRTEYRYSTYQAADLPVLSVTTGLPVGTSAVNSKKFVQTVRSELVYRFNLFH
jgi:outer membrane immunogenic protein